MLNCLINTIRQGVGLAGRVDGDVVVAGNLFEGDSSSKVDQPVDLANKYTQESRCLFDINLLSFKFKEKYTHAIQKQPVEGRVSEEGTRIQYPHLDACGGLRPCSGRDPVPGWR